MVYLDHAASTPMRPEAIAALTAQLERVGNAASLHAAGRDARRIVEESREAVAQAIGARPSEVVFTGSGTEADNLAVKGLFWARRAADPRRRRVIASAIEHHAVLDCVEWLQTHEGADVTWLDVDAAGRVDPETLRAAIARNPHDVALVAVMWVNNEVGTIEPVRELAEIAHEYDVPFHTDAVQAVGHVPVDFATSGVDSLALSGHKFGGPIGVGALVLARGIEVVPVLHGGGQERDVRSGTLDVASIAALAAATEVAVKFEPEESERLGRLRSRLIAGITAAVPDAVLNGAPASTSGHAPGIAHFSFPGCEGDSLLLLLDARGIECSTGSACSAGVARPSYVLLAMGRDEAQARSSLRFSLGHPSTEADVDALVDAIGPVVDRGRRAGLASTS
jgi:cysteine desulfurase